MIPYGRQSIDDSDIAAVVEALRSDWLTTGPRVAAFERAFAAYTGAAHAVAVNSGTAALHAALHSWNLSPGDEVIVPANTFVATANAVLYVGGRPVFADIEPDTFLLDPVDVKARITPKTRGIVGVDYAGAPCDYDALQKIADEHGLRIHADACHALGARFGDRKVGALALTNSFSLHPVKPITAAEGGMVTTDDERLAARMRVFRNNGVSVDFRGRAEANTWEYDVLDLGWNYRLSDLQCALGLSQLSRVDDFVQRRNAVAEAYDAGLGHLDWLKTPVRREGCTHAFHLYVCTLRRGGPEFQKRAFQILRSQGIGAHIMYKPVYRHTYYSSLGYAPGICPIAEKVYEEILILPMHCSLTDADIAETISAVRNLGQAI